MAASEHPLGLVIRLRHSVVIDVAPESVWDWLTELPAHYRDWHPAHVDCRYARGTSLEIGAVLSVEEDLHGRRHRLRLRVTEVVPARLLRYQTRSFTGAFVLAPANGATRFTAELDFGIRTPFIGSVLDAIMRWVLGRRFAEFETHMREEGVNLKRLLEAPRPQASA